MPVRQGLTLADTFKVGSNAVSKLYKGSDLVWEPAASGLTSPITVVEEKFTTFAGTGPQSVTFATTPQPGDKVIVLYGSHRATSVRVISSIVGMGGVWSLLFTHTNQLSAWIGEDLTSSGVVTITQNSAAVMTAHLYLVRGLSSRFASGQYQNLGGGALMTAAADCGYGQIGLGWMLGFDATLGNITQFPGAKVPTSGWDVNDSGYNTTNAFGSAYRLPGEQPKTPHSVQSQIISGDSGSLIMMVVGDYGYTWMDHGERANAALGSDWQLLNGVSLTIVSKAFASPDANTNHMATVAVAPSADQWSQARMTVAGTMGVGARFTPSGAAETGYVWRYSGSDCQLFYVSAGSFTAIGSAYSAVLAAGSQLRIECQGTTIRGLVDGVVRATATHSGVSAAGRGSLRMAGTTVRAKNFAMGVL